MAKASKTDFGPTPSVTPKDVMYQVVAAVEGGCNYWMAGFYLKKARKKPKESPWYADENVYTGNFLIQVKLDEPHEDEKLVYDFTPEAVRRGLQFLADKYPHRLAEITGDNGDAETADVFIQACLFGEIVYG